MSRKRSPDREKAFKLWCESGRTRTPSSIAEELGIKPAMVRQWKHLDGWETRTEPKRKRRGAPKGNQNAAGNNGGAPQRNQNATKHGLYRKFLPQDPEYQELLNFAQDIDPLDMLWQTIEIAYTKMIWSQNIMHVKDGEDHTKLVKKWTEDGKEYEYHIAQDKQALDVSAFVNISRELRIAIKQFLNVAPENDERRIKLELMRSQVEKAQLEVKKLEGSREDTHQEDWIKGLQEIAKRRKREGSGGEES